ncbi:MAG: endolytic transglycosylase MltG [Schwartzia sp. (in: firmicutes)]
MRVQDWLIRQLEQLADWIGAFSWEGVRMGRKFFLGVGAAALFLAVGLALLVLFSAPTAPPAGGEAKDTPIYLEVKPGMTAGEIGKILDERHVISHRVYFWLLAKANGVEGSFQTGTYKFHPQMDVREVLEMLAQGKTAPLRFTIPEGFTVNEIAARLGEEGIVSAAELKAEAARFAPYPYMEQKAAATYQAEGFLFPDTYEIAPGMTAREILRMMARNFDERLTEALRRRAAEMGLSVFDLVTLASLVEKEARFEEDRAIIAQVFFERLRIGMPLQSCATIQYLLPVPKEELSYEDTEIESPYNTYQHMGLPPGPVANPGLAAIHAVLYPATTNYLYFVADREGHHHYSRNYSDHLVLVEQVR